MSSLLDRVREDRARGHSDAARDPGERWGLRWAPVPLAFLYLILLAPQLGAVVRASDLNADAVSAEVIGQLFGRAGPHASTVLGTFGWYASLLAELATRWLPEHRYVWELMPFAMALASVALVTWSVWRLAGRWAASITAVLLTCASPALLLLLLSMTQHAPDWFCCALLGAFLVAVEQPRPGAASVRTLTCSAVLVGVVVGINAASDALVILAAVLPFMLALGASHVLAWRQESRRTLSLAAVLLVAVIIAAVATKVLMSAWRVAPEAGLKLFQLGSAGQVSKNVGLWFQGISTLANGAYFNRNLSVGALLAVACAGLSIAAFAWTMRFGWREFRVAVDRFGQQESATEALEAAEELEAAEALEAAASASTAATAASPARLPFVVYWLTSAVGLSLIFVISTYPHDVRGDRYLGGVLYAVAALLPLAGAGRRWRELAVVVGTCVFALSAVSSLRLRLATRQPVSPTTTLAKQVAAVAAAHDLRYGFGEYWDAAPITWTTDLRVRVYPVQTCPRGRRLCPFYLHVISSWYAPQPGTRSFLLIDPSKHGIIGPAPDLGRPSAVYRIGKVRMYVYPYDIASRFQTRYEQWRSRQTRYEKGR